MSRVIDLSGPDGNAYALMAYARKWARELGDYNHLLDVMDREFGGTVEWVGNDPRAEKFRMRRQP